MSKWSSSYYKSQRRRSDDYSLKPRPAMRGRPQANREHRGSESFTRTPRSAADRNLQTPDFSSKLPWQRMTSVKRYASTTELRTDIDHRKSVSSDASVHPHCHNTRDRYMMNCNNFCIALCTLFVWASLHWFTDGSIPFRQIPRGSYGQGKSGKNQRIRESQGI